MTLRPGDEIEVAVEKPAAGGRMIARHQGQVVLVAGAVPGEQVTARVEWVEKRLAFAAAIRILAPSVDRRPHSGDALCGGCAYAHIAYARQLTLKSQVIGDAFARVGRIPLEASVPVLGSPEDGYRMRARLHVRGRRAGFYREGTHDLCDAGATGQLTRAAMTVVEEVLAHLSDRALEVRSVELSENIAADERALHLEIAATAADVTAALAAAMTVGGLTGLTARTEAGAFHDAGVPRVADPLATLTQGRVEAGALRRRPASFFQANRFLIANLVGAVLEGIPADGDVLDLYAGVGLFAVSLAASGRRGVTAVEGDRVSGADLADNAGPYAGTLRVIVGRVEDHVAPDERAAETILADPPRTGISRDAMEAIVRHRPRRVVYVSCDPPTMARDARRLLDAGYGLTSLEGFDLFPNTPHVETVGILDRR
jgi:23S rRNA (uracil1939-C5)-methyltransferase